MRHYTYNLGFAVNGTPLPDPSGFSGSTSDLDVSAERDVTGLLHRDRVATKIPTEMRYTNIDWQMCQTILYALRHDQFLFTFPNPNTGTMSEIIAYTGDRKWDCIWLPHDTDGSGWYANLTFSVIEY